MNCIKKYIEYLKDNPQGYWFKRKLYGWGWVPVKWQGWLVIVIGLSIFFAGMYVGETDDAPGATLLGLILMLLLIFFFGYKKGEKPRWQWGPYEKNDSNGRSKNKIIFLTILIISAAIIILGILIITNDRVMEKTSSISENSSWEKIKNTIMNCEAERTFQSHSRNVNVKLKDGSKLTAVEPQLDDIIKVAIGAEPKCGRVIMATE